MNPKQKRTVAVLGVANLVVIASLTALLAYVAHSSALPPPTPISTTPGGSVGPTGETCQWQAAQQLAQAGLGGAVTLPAGDALRFEIDTTLAPGQTADDAAQLIWMALDVALALDDACPFTRVEVAIHVQDAAATLHANVGAADLAAYGAGDLSENELIDRVTYTIEYR